jgi:predicted permease
VIADADLILPHQFDRNKVFLGNFSFQAVARLKPGASLTQADADVARMLTIWQDAWPTPPGFDRNLFKNARLGPKVELLKQDVVGDIGNMLWVLLGTIGLVLLIACANVANLLLVRAEGRQQEMAVRAALGAGWGRIARQMLVESVVLGLAGGVLGLGLAYGVLRLLVTTGPATLPRLNEIGLDGATITFALAISAVAGVFFGLMPVLKYAKPDGAAALRGGGRTASHSRERHRARNVLVVAQVALALVLLVGSGLMIRTFQKLRSVQPGFARSDQVQLIRISVPEKQPPEPQRVMRMQNDILEKIAAIPGVRSVSFGNSAPMEGFNSNDIMFARDKTYAAGQIPPVRRFRFIAPGYFQTLGTPIVAGRDFMWNELYDLHDVAIVSENLARELWGAPAAALGKQIREGMNDPWREIVGVTGDVYDNGVQETPPAIVYWPALMSQFWMDKVHANPFGVFVIRTERAATESLLSDVRQAVWSIAPSLPVFLVRTLGDVYDRTQQRTSFTLVMLVTAGGMALVLGLIGIYGVISYSVSQRTREIGIRMALGAEGGALKKMFLRSGLLLTAVGVAIGLGAAAGATRLMTSLLYGVTALDPITYVAVPLALASAALLASYVPARRAVRVDPVEALRAE